MDNPFADTLHLSVQPSATHRIFVAGLHGAALLILCALAVSRPLFWVLVPVAIASALLADRQARLRNPRSIVRLRWQRDDGWRWQTADERWHEGRRVSAFVFGDRLVVLRLRQNARRFGSASCVLFRDAVAASGHRHLRARLTIAPDPRARADEPA